MSHRWFVPLGISVLWALGLSWIQVPDAKAVTKAECDVSGGAVVEQLDKNGKPTGKWQCSIPEGSKIGGAWQCEGENNKPLVDHCTKAISVGVETLPPRRPSATITPQTPGISPETPERPATLAPGEKFILVLPTAQRSIDGKGSTTIRLPDGRQLRISKGGPIEIVNPAGQVIERGRFVRWAERSGMRPAGKRATRAARLGAQAGQFLIYR